MKNTNITVGRNIRELRRRDDISMTALAEMLGVSQQQLSRYERGVNKIDVSIVFDAAIIFDVSCDYLFSGCESSQFPTENEPFTYLEPQIAQH